MSLGNRARQSVPQRGKQIGRHDGLGVIVTLERRDNGDTRSAHATHKLRLEALRTAVAPFDADVWRVVSISTPDSIYADITGARKLTVMGETTRGDARPDRRQQIAYSTGGVIPPEPTMLARAGLRRYL